MKLPFLNNGVAQICIVVKDIEKTVQNYWDVFGVGPWHFYTYKKPMVKEMSYHGEPADYEMRIALSYFGDSRIELIQPISGDSIYSDFIEEHGLGVPLSGVWVRMGKADARLGRWS